MLPKITICYDREGYVFHRIALKLQAHLRSYSRPHLARHTDVLPPVNTSIVIVLWWASPIIHYWKHNKDSHLLVCLYDHYTFRGRFPLLKKVLKTASVLLCSNTQLLKEIQDHPDKFLENMKERVELFCKEFKMS